MKSCASCARRFSLEQLADWFRDEEAWLQDRSFDMFCLWFDFQHHSMLVDLSGEPLIDETTDMIAYAIQPDKPLRSTFGERPLIHGDGCTFNPGDEFDAVMVTFAVPHIMQKWVRQLPYTKSCNYVVQH